MALQITDNNFQSEVVESGKLAVVDFWAEWCGPCRLIGPTIEALAHEYEGKVVVGKVNVDENPGLSVQFGVRNIPLVLFLKDGKVIDKVLGASSKSKYRNKIEQHLTA